MATRMQQRRGTAAEWAAANPILADGEIGVVTDTGVIKVGDGATRWASLKTPFVKVSGDTMKGSTPSQIPLSIQATTDQTADLFRVVNVDGAVLAGITKNGVIYETGVDFTRETSGTSRAKGDLLVGNSPNSLIRLPVGSDGQILKADSSTPTGTKWDVGPTPVDIQVFTSSANWTKRPGARVVEVIGIGAGGGGLVSGTDFGNSASGGYGGFWGRMILPASALADSVAVTVGLGGAPNTNGGDSVFDRLRVPGGLKGFTVGSGSGVNHEFGGGNGGRASVSGSGVTSATAGGSALGGTGIGMGARGGAGFATTGSGGSFTAESGVAPGGGGGSIVSRTGALVTPGSGARGEVLVFTYF